MRKNRLKLRLMAKYFFFTLRARISKIGRLKRERKSERERVKKMKKGLPQQSKSGSSENARRRLRWRRFRAWLQLGELSAERLFAFYICLKYFLFLLLQFQHVRLQRLARLQQNQLARLEALRAFLCRLGVIGRHLQVVGVFAYSLGAASSLFIFLVDRVLFRRRFERRLFASGLVTYSLQPAQESKRIRANFELILARLVESNLNLANAVAKNRKLEQELLQVCELRRLNQQLAFLKRFAAKSVQELQEHEIWPPNRREE